MPSSGIRLRSPPRRRGPVRQPAAGSKVEEAERTPDAGWPSLAVRRVAQPRRIVISHYDICRAAERQDRPQGRWLPHGAESPELTGCWSPRSSEPFTSRSPVSSPDPAPGTTAASPGRPRGGHRRRPYRGRVSGRRRPGCAPGRSRQQLWVPPPAVPSVTSSRHHPQMRVPWPGHGQAVEGGRPRCGWACRSSPPPPAPPLAGPGGRVSTAAERVTTISPAAAGSPPPPGHPAGS